jgi:cytochrome c oxidase subunit I+III
MAFADRVGFLDRLGWIGFRVLVVLRRLSPRHDRLNRMVLAGTPSRGGLMSEQRILDVSDLPPYDVSNHTPLFWGQALMCVIEGSLFCMLIATYFYLRLRVDVWPGPGVHLPDLTYSSWALVPLIASCAGSYLADEAAKINSRAGMLWGSGLNLGLAIIFLVLRALEWKTFNFTWASDAYGSIVWAILFLHTYDIVADLLVTAVLVVIVASGRYGPRQQIGIHVDSVLWYFLVGMWIVLYAVVYWAPRLIGAAR